MPNAETKHYLILHFLVFIAGFTGILGALISIGSIQLVWFRMAMAAVIMLLYIKIVKLKINVDSKAKIKFLLAGIIIALHWITFFESIKQSNVSIALSMFSTGAFFASFIEPLIFKRRIVWYEIVFGILVAIGVFLITQSEIKYLNGILLGISCAIFSSIFAVLNGKFVKSYRASVISFYEFIGGITFISLFLLIFRGGFKTSFFSLSPSDWFYIFILASICTAYAFIAAVNVMRHISPYTVVLSYNLEPIYGIVLAILLFPEKEIMSPKFYLGAVLIISTLLLNAYFKKFKRAKNKTALQSNSDNLS